MGNDLRSEKVKVGELDIRYFAGGQGAPLIVVHGGGNCSEAWLQNAVELSQWYKVFIPDLPGFGGSESIDGDCALPEFVLFIDGFSRSLGLKRFHLVGHSFGGGVALNYALDFPHKVKRLVLVSSICLGREIALWARLLSHPILCMPVGEAALLLLRGARRVVKALHAPFEVVNPLVQVKTGASIARSIITLKGQTTVLLNRLPELLVPTLLVWGSRDGIVPATHCYAASELIPDCHMYVFEGCGYSVYRERVAEFSRLLTNLLG